LGIGTTDLSRIRVKDRWGSGGYFEVTLLLHSRLSTAIATAMLLSALASSVAHAADSCKLEVAAELAPAWRLAVTALPPLSRDDCARLSLEPSEPGVQLTFVTRDGSSARRQLGEPNELAPAVAALRVVALKPTAASETDPDPDPAVQASAGADLEPSPLWLGLGSGARGGDASLLSPLVSGSAVLAFDPWEFGVTLAFDLRYFDLERRASQDRQPGTLAVGALLGRREPLGDLAVVWGGRAALAMLTSQSSSSSGSAEDGADASKLEGSPFEGRFGVYVGLSLPAARSVRIRTELGADVVAASRARTSSSEDAAAGVPVTPSWALSAAIGLELAP